MLFHLASLCDQATPDIWPSRIQVCIELSLKGLSLSMPRGLGSLCRWPRPGVGGCGV